MTKTQSQWVTWRWVDPRWWVERQIQAAAYMIRLTGSVVDASLSSLCGIAGRSVSAPAASVYAPAAETITARVTAPAAAPAPARVTAPAAVTVPAAAPASANGTRPALLPPWELLEPQRGLAAVKPEPQLEAVKPEAELEAVKPEAELEAVKPEAELEAVKPEAELEAVKPEAELEVAQPGPQLEVVKPEAELEAAVPEPEQEASTDQEATERAWAGAPPVPEWDELTLGSIRARLRRLSEDDLVALHGYEESHAGRPEVLSMLQNRLTKIRSEDQGS